MVKYNKNLIQARLW